MVIEVSNCACLLLVRTLTVNTHYHLGLWQTLDINVEENVVENDFPNNNDSYHSEKLMSPISIDDEGDGNERRVFPQFINSNAKFIRFTWS